MPVTSLLPYVAAVLVLFVIPGPAVMIVTTRSLSSGRRAGIATGVGIGVADALHATFTVVGFSAVLLTSATLFTLLKYAGAAYLAYLGVRALFARGTGTPANGAVRTRAVGAREAFRQGFVSEILNPKTALFFLSFLPQFVNPSAGSVTTQLLVLGAIFVVMSLIYTTALAALAGAIAARWRASGPRSSAWGSRLVGVVFLLIAARVALQER